MVKSSINGQFSIVMLNYQEGNVILFCFNYRIWMWKRVPRNPLVRPHSNNTSKQYDILITRGSMKTRAIRSDFDFKFS